MSIGKAAPGARAIAPGLHLVSTPIGAARDITLRALDVLTGADVLAAEDTRTLRHLMEIHGIPVGGRPLVAYHEHNAPQALPRLLQAMAEGKSVAYASEAGTPLVSDPGFELARETAARGLPLTAAPGPSAVLCALTVSGLPSDRFLFAGFPPATASARATWLAELAPVPATLILYESPRRVRELLAECALQLGTERKAALCRELTKRFEEVTRGTLAELTALFDDREVKGEVVLVIDRAEKVRAGAEDIAVALDLALSEMSVKDAAALIAEAYGLPRKEVYRMALERGKA